MSSSSLRCTNADEVYMVQSVFQTRTTRPASSGTALPLPSLVAGRTIQSPRRALRVKLQAQSAGRASRRAR